MYPFPLLNESVTVAPLFGDALRGQPYIFDFTSENPQTLSYDPSAFQPFQDAVYGELEGSGKQWGIGRYLEERGNVLRHYPQMITEGRIYHMGLDVTSLPGTPLFAPLDGEVFMIGKEQGIGNYGGFVVLKHRIGEDTFYSLYGHLCSRHIVQEGQKIAAGERFAVIGDGSDSGGWFTHTHVQVITEEAHQRGRMFHGYASAKDIPTIESLFPSPYVLFRY